MTEFNWDEFEDNLERDLGIDLGRPGRSRSDRLAARQPDRGQRGLFKKYLVYKNERGYDAVSERTFVFTLVPETDQAAKAALQAYADAVLGTNTNLALEIYQRIADDNFEPIR